MNSDDNNTYSETLSRMQCYMARIHKKCSLIESERNEIRKKLVQVSRYMECPEKLDMHFSENEKKVGRENDSAPVFVTARFRSGSTFLWNFLRSIPGVTAYYEPLQENLLEHLDRQTPAQKSHVGVASYWEEYRPIEQELTKYHRREFGFKKLLLEKDDEYPELAAYIDFLIRSTAHKTPVLQFNRIDFRLPWLRQQFPDAKIIHLYRNPRDQWFSMVRDKLSQDVTAPDINTNYDMFLWSVYLTKFFPFLAHGIESSYERHYYIWRMSEMMGRRCSDVSIDYDTDILEAPEKAFRKLNRVMNSGSREESFASQVSPVETGRWRDVRPSDWFEAIEEKCEKKLAELGLNDLFGIKTLSEIKNEYGSSWRELAVVGYEEMLEKVISLLLTDRGETAAAIERINGDVNHMVLTCNEVGENSQKVVDKYIESKRNSI